MHLVSVDKLEKDRHRALVATSDDFECNVEALSKIAAPGSFFCHELLVFLSFLANSAYEQLDSPALIVNANWYARMRAIVDSLESLCTDIEYKHLDSVEVPEE